MKLRVKYDDGNHRGGLIKPTLPLIDVPLWDLPSIGEHHRMLVMWPDLEGAPFVFHLAPSFDFESARSNEYFDPDSFALRIRFSAALEWFKRLGIAPPRQLVEKVRNREPDYDANDEPAGASMDSDIRPALRQLAAIPGPAVNAGLMAPTSSDVLDDADLYVIVREHSVKIRHAGEEGEFRRTKQIKSLIFLLEHPNVGHDARTVLRAIGTIDARPAIRQVDLEGPSVGTTEVFARVVFCRHDQAAIPSTNFRPSSSCTSCA